MRFRLRWALYKDQDPESGTRDDAHWEDVESVLTQTESRPGSVILSRLDAPEIGQQRIEVFGEDHKYLITVVVVGQEDTGVLSYTSTDYKKGQTVILGNYWDNRLLCQDYSVVIQLFREFFQRGRVSSQQLT